MKIVETGRCELQNARSEVARATSQSVGTKSSDPCAEDKQLSPPRQSSLIGFGLLPDCMRYVVRGVVDVVGVLEEEESSEMGCIQSIGSDGGDSERDEYSSLVSREVRIWVATFSLST